MLEIVYRIYEIAEVDIQFNRYNFDCEEQQEPILKKDKIELSMDILICENREQFKEIIKSMYGENVKFANSKKHPLGTILCVIIGEHAFAETKERYFNKKKFICDECGSETTTYVDSEVKCSNWDFTQLEKQHIDYQNKLFCSLECKRNFIIRETKLLKENTDNSCEWISRNSFTNTTPKGTRGYIYKITKRSTCEFYVGQSVYVPIFRWGQHLNTDRFSLKNINDYIFEIIEIVSGAEPILEREKFWIQKLWKENPSLSLNIMQTQKLKPQMKIDFENLEETKEA